MISRRLQREQYGKFAHYLKGRSEPIALERPMQIEDISQSPCVGMAESERALTGAANALRAGGKLAVDDAVPASQADDGRFGHLRALACKTCLLQRRNWPPSTDSVCPVTHVAASLQRKRAAFATSSGMPRRPHGIERRTAL
jgi:hypothetical protein